ncbi:WD40 repeat domain-containing serine/threonine protein kinase [Kitasatospora sp. NPDC093550]|uniref:WD40 repeat domain-containing serine/threonine protein kinase n=1 Tax=Kitasatospora sp. NPDC093550 TaxID=3364089 RepID=UPI0038170387
MTGAVGELVGGRYRLVETVGRGGMGRVWRGHDERLDRVVAVKEVLLPPGAEPELRAELLARTEREARAAARLRHPGIVTVHDVVHHREVPWIVMEFIAGPSLARLIRGEGRLGWERVAVLGAGIAEALAHAHAAGVVHRDLKPDNVLLAGDRPVITDFGIARLLDATQQLTGTHTVIGTPQFMPPEQLEAGRVEAPADLWALGATLYTAVEGRPPFDGPTLTAVIAAVLTQPVPPAVHAGPLATLLDELLSKDAARRPDAQVVAERLRAAVQSRTAARTPTLRADLVDAPVTDVHAAPTVATGPAATAAQTPGTVPTRVDRPRRPSRRGVLIGGLAALATAAGGAVAAVRGLGDDKANGAGSWTALRGADSQVTSLAYSPDGKLLAGGCKDGTVRIWDTGTGKVTATLDPKSPVPAQVGKLGFAPDGKSLVAGTTSGLPVTRIWDLATAAITWQTAVGTLLAVSPDARTIAAFFDNELILWDTATDTRTAAVSGARGWAVCAAFSPDGKTLAIGGPDKTFRLWNPGSGAPPVAATGEGDVVSVAFTPNGKSVLTACTGKGGLLMRAANGTAPVTVVLGGGPASLVVPSPDGNTVATVASVDNAATKLQLWSLGSRAVTATLDPFDRDVFTMTPPPVAISPDSRTVAAGDDANLVRLWRLHSS